MNICLISENSYPVSTGGVSEWCNSLVSNMPEYNFQIITLASNNKIKYDVPENVAVETIKMDRPRFTDESTNSSLIKKIMNSLSPVLRGEPVDCSSIYQILNEEKITARELISSTEHKQRMLTYYKENYSGEPFKFVRKIINTWSLCSCQIGKKK